MWSRGHHHKNNEITSNPDIFLTLHLLSVFQPQPSLLFISSMSFNPNLPYSVSHWVFNQNLKLLIDISIFKKGCQGRGRSKKGLKEEVGPKRMSRKRQVQKGCQGRGRSKKDVKEEVGPQYLPDFETFVSDFKGF